MLPRQMKPIQEDTVGSMHNKMEKHLSPKWSELTSVFTITKRTPQLPPTWEGSSLLYTAATCGISFSPRSMSPLRLLEVKTSLPSRNEVAGQNLASSPLLDFLMVVWGVEV